MAVLKKDRFPTKREGILEGYGMAKKQRTLKFSDLSVLCFYADEQLTLERTLYNTF